MIEFERADAHDAEILIEIKKRAFAWDVDKYGMGPPGYDSLDDLVRAINRALYYKIMDNRKTIGGFGLYKMGEEHFELGSLYIDPEYQNRGIGAMAIRFIEKTYPEVTRWTLDTPYLSFRNQHLYEKMGYKKVGEEKPEGMGNFVLFKYEKRMSWIGQE